jgi:hypothetical protein
MEPWEILDSLKEVVVLVPVLKAQVPKYEAFEMGSRKSESVIS